MTDIARQEILPIPPEEPLELILADVIDLQEHRIAQVPEVALVGMEVDLVQQPESHDGADEFEFLRRQDQRKVEMARKDEAAFESLLNEHMGLIKNLTKDYFVKGGDSDDVMQEALLGFYAGVEGYDGEKSTFRNFAMLCMRRRVLTAVKTANRHKHGPLNSYVSFSHRAGNQNEGGVISLADAIPDDARLTEDVVIGHEDFIGLTDILSSKLTQIESSALNLYLEGKSYGSIADDLGVDIKTIDNALQRVKRKVLKHLSSSE